jgi:hypothetical protein
MSVRIQGLCSSGEFADVLVQRQKGVGYASASDYHGRERSPRTGESRNMHAAGAAGKLIAKRFYSPSILLVTIANFSTVNREISH